MAKKVSNPFRKVNGNACAAVASAIEFDSLRDAYSEKKTLAKKLVSAGIESLIQQGVERTEAIGYARKALMEAGLDEKRASSLLVSLGFKVRNGGGTPAECDANLLKKIVEFIKTETGNLDSAAMYANRALLAIREERKAAKAAEKAAK